MGDSLPNFFVMIIADVLPTNYCLALPFFFFFFSQLQWSWGSGQCIQSHFLHIITQLMEVSKDIFTYENVISNRLDETFCQSRLWRVISPSPYWLMIAKERRRRHVHMTLTQPPNLHSQSSNNKASLKSGNFVSLKNISPFSLFLKLRQQQNAPF